MNGFLIAGRKKRGLSPILLDPPDWICPLLAIGADAFNHGGTPEFAAISAGAMRHNHISDTLSAAPDKFRPVHRRKANGDVDARPWCRGFYAAMQLRMPAWARLLNLADINHGLLLPILLHSVDDHGRPLFGPTKKGREGKDSCVMPTRIFRPPSRPCANTGREQVLPQIPPPWSARPAYDEPPYQIRPSCLKR
ncbi:UPF0149 family protein [Bradyrhizobium sp. SZCCHNRI20481]|uniref:UPF0149 family protein n=1 Tax=Bradyrhizobium sp. SZCCHNRI20481 TaxID=3057286 RepID=UPI0029161887|nr:UPF0149 family protein [Bradyrhizobium sp. SZCCHNRI20481]